MRSRLLTVQAVEPVEVIAMPAVLGAEVRCGDVRGLSDSAFAVIRRAALDHLVILIRGQTLTDPELIAFGGRFGTLDCAPLAKTGKEKARAHPEIVVVSNVMEDGQAIGVLRDAEVVWHSDNSYREQPLSFSALYALEIPERGGNTGFANMYLALESLDPALRARIEGRTLKHDMTYNSAGDLRAGFTPVGDVRDAPGPSHPIIRTHPETAYDALYLGRRPNAYINGLSVKESEALLDALWSHATQPRFTWHHVWQRGDILMWDNRCVMHRRDAFAAMMHLTAQRSGRAGVARPQPKMHHRDPFDAGARRVMHRVQCAGERPYRAAHASSGHPRSRLER